MKARIVRLLGVAEGQTSETGSGGLESELTSRRDEQNEIQLLDLTTNNVGDQECAAIAEFILGAGSSLAAVRLGGNKISSRVSSGWCRRPRRQRAARAVAGQQQPRLLGVRALADARCAPSWPRGWLCGFPADDGAVALGEALCDAPLPVLRWPLLNNNHIGDDGAQALAAALPVLPRLAMLSLRCNAVATAARRRSRWRAGGAEPAALFLETNALSCVGIARRGGGTAPCDAPSCGSVGWAATRGRRRSRACCRACRASSASASPLADEADLDGAAASIVRAIPSAPRSRADGIDLCLHLRLGLPSTLHQTSSNHAIFQRRRGAARRIRRRAARPPPAAGRLPPPRRGGRIRERTVCIDTYTGGSPLCV